MWSTSSQLYSQRIQADTEEENKALKKRQEAQSLAH